LHRLYLFISFLGLGLLGSAAHADQPNPWQIGFQEAASPVMRQMYEFHGMLLVIITVITIFVTFLLAYICVRFYRKVNKTPSKVSHNTLIEIVWTVIPILILIVIAIPSLRLLYKSDVVPEAEMTLKAIGYQWYWGYQYPDHGDIAFDSYMIPDDEIDVSKGQVRLLEVDNRIVLPIDTVIRIQLTAADVIHAFAIPAFGLKVDAVPGRLNEAWVKIEKPGVYRGQCSELCGIGHGFMPIVIEAVSKEEFAAWVEGAKEKYSKLGSGAGLAASN
jgi:cytochrome c oxidase subunit 2